MNLLNIRAIRGCTSLLPSRRLFALLVIAIALLATIATPVQAQNSDAASARDSDGAFAPTGPLSLASTSRATPAVATSIPDTMLYSGIDRDIVRGSACLLIPALILKAWCGMLVVTDTWDEFLYFLDEVVVPGFIIDLEGEPLDIVQQLLGHLGAIPGYGIFFDVGNAVISLARDNIGDMIFYTAAAIPIAGIAVYAIVRLKGGYQLLKKAKSVSEAAELAKRSWVRPTTVKIMMEVPGQTIPHIPKRVGKRVAKFDNYGNEIRPYNYTAGVEGISEGTSEVSGLVSIRVHEPIDGIPTTRHAEDYFDYYDSKLALSDKQKQVLKKDAGIPKSEYSDWSVDHIFPRGFHGPHIELNFAVLHTAANRKKAAIEKLIGNLAKVHGNKVKMRVQLVGLKGRKPDAIWIHAEVNGTPVHFFEIPNGPSAKHVIVDIPNGSSARSAIVPASPILVAGAAISGGQEAAGSSPDMPDSSSSWSSDTTRSSVRSVSLALGEPATGAKKQKYCADEPYCYWFDIDLQGDFGPGPHRYQCFTVGLPGAWRDNPEGRNPDQQCLYWHPNNQVYVIVDGVRSNTLTWDPPPVH